MEISAEKYIEIQQKNLRRLSELFYWGLLEELNDMYSFMYIYSQFGRVQKCLGTVAAMLKQISEIEGLQLCWEEQTQGWKTDWEHYLRDAEAENERA